MTALLDTLELFFELIGDALGEEGVVLPVEEELHCFQFDGVGDLSLHEGVVGKHDFLPKKNGVVPSYISVTPDQLEQLHGSAVLDFGTLDLVEGRLA